MGRPSFTVERVCKVCGRHFQALPGPARYCSEACRKKAKTEQKKAKGIGGQHYKTLVCCTCGREFKTIHGNQRFCSQRCRAMKLKASIPSESARAIMARKTPEARELWRGLEKLLTIPDEIPLTRKGVSLHTIATYEEEGHPSVLKVLAMKPAARRIHSANWSRSEAAAAKAILTRRELFGKENLDEEE